MRHFGRGLSFGAITGNLRVRNGAANMSGLGMPAGVKGVAGVAV